MHFNHWYHPSITSCEDCSNHVSSILGSLDTPKVISCSWYKKLSFAVHTVRMVAPSHTLGHWVIQVLIDAEHLTLSKLSIMIWIKETTPRGCLAQPQWTKNHLQNRISLEPLVYPIPRWKSLHLLPPPICLMILSALSHKVRNLFCYLLLLLWCLDIDTMSQNEPFSRLPW